MMDATNVIGYVIKLVATCFPKDKCPILSKAFNKDNVTCTYRVGRNMKAFIDSHNKTLLNKREVPTETPAGELCICRGGVAYEAEVRAVEVSASSSGAEVERD